MNQYQQLSPSITTPAVTSITSIPSPSLSIPNYSQGIYNLSNINSITTNINNGGNDWERMLYSTGIKRDIPSFPQQQQQQQQFTTSSYANNQDGSINSLQQNSLNSPFISTPTNLLPSSKVGNTPLNSNLTLEHLMNNSLSTKPPINSLSSADSAFGFNSSNHQISKKQSNYQDSNIYENEISLKTPLSHNHNHNHHHHQNNDNNNNNQHQHQQEQEQQDLLQFSSNYHSSISPSPNATPSYLLKKGIIFEDENDDPGSISQSSSSKSITDHRRNLKHQTLYSENNSKDESHDGFDNDELYQKHQNNQKTSNKKQLKDKNKLTKLSNGALVKKKV